MPGKEADFPSRKQRKAAGKNGIMGRAAGSANALPLYERSRDDESGLAGNENVNGVGGQTDPKVHAGSISYGYARDLE